MKSKKIFLFLLFYSGTIFSQKAIIQSFEHSVRWLPEQNYPNFSSNKHLQDTVLLVTSEALKRKFNVKEVVLPNDITYKYYEGFGKPKLKVPTNSIVSGDYDVTILSFITRGTYDEFEVYWKMEIAIQQNGITTFSNKTEHELVCFTPSNSNSGQVKINEPEFIEIYKSLLNELLDGTKNIPKKIKVGSQKSVDNSIATSIPNSTKFKMITNGNFMSNSNFSVTVEKEGISLLSVVYHKEKASSKGKGNFSGWVFANTMTALSGNGSSSSYMKKTRETREGNLEFSSGEIHKLKMEWEQNTEKEVVNDADNDGIIATRTGYSEPLSPMKIEIIRNDSLYGDLIYFKEGEIFVVDGKIKNHTINVSYAPSTNLLRVIENNETQVIVEMNNVNPANPNSFAGNTTSKKIFFPSTKSKLPEWYTVYAEHYINEVDTANYMEAVFCLFFGIGNHS